MKQQILWHNDIEVKALKTSKDILASVLKTTQMGQVGIRAVMPYVTDSSLQKELTFQLNEYSSIERQAHTVASSRGWTLNELDPVVKSMSTMWAKAHLSLGRSDSKIAAMMINGNTKGMIKGLKNIHHSESRDKTVNALAEKLLDTENSNIGKMHGFV